MIAHRNQKPPTAAERHRIDRIMALSCVVCALRGDFKPRPLELHHIVRANKRLGHLYTIQLCVGHHRGIWTDQDVRVAISDGRHAFREAHGYSDLELWQGLQQVLGLSDELPASKIFRRVA